MLSADSFATLQALSISDPITSLFLKRVLAHTYDEFIDVLYQDLDEILHTVQERKQIYFEATEDEITMFIVDMLKQRGYIAEHDTKIGGHVDIVVRGRNPIFLWLGEAKRDGGAGWLEQGMEQLCSRYSDGSHGRQQGGILVYIQGKFAARILEKWRNRLATRVDIFEDIKLSDCSRTPGSAFVSTHIHETSGLPYVVRHIGIGLYHRPTK